MARHSQPNNIKALKGEARPERFAPDGVDVKKLSDLPEPPQWWDVRTVKFYEEKGALLLANNLLTALDVDYLFKFCWLAVKIDRICESQDTPSMSMYSQYDKFSAKLALTVVDRQKVKGDSGIKKQNKYAKSKLKR